MKLAQLSYVWFFALAATIGCDSPNKTTSDKKADEKSSAAVPEKNEGDKAKEHAEKIKTALAKLSPEDKKQAEAQAVCPVSKEPLGSMGVPIKVTVGEKSIFICCEGCEKDARENIEKHAVGIK